MHPITPPRPIRSALEAPIRNKTFRSNWLNVFGTKVVDNWWITMLVNGGITNYQPHAYQTLLAFWLALKSRRDKSPPLQKKRKQQNNLYPPVTRCRCPNVVQVFFSFLKFSAETCTYPSLGALVPLFWTSDDVSSEFQSQSGFFPYANCGDECNIYTFPEIHLWCFTLPTSGQSALLGSNLRWQPKVATTALPKPWLGVKLQPCALHTPRPKNILGPTPGPPKIKKKSFSGQKGD